jgi:hypothetical protein
MASTFTTLGIEKMATGENAGTWGDKTNTNLDIVNTAISGYVEQAVTSGGTLALSITDGAATSTAQNAVIKLTGTITGNSIVTVPDSVEKVYIVTNGTSGAYTVQFKTASGTGVTFGVSEKTTKLFYSDGTNIVDAGFSGGTDLDGKELILDADADTSITADTDDQIDIKIAGADDFQFTANTFTAQSGSSIVVPDGGLTFGSTAITSTAAELNLLDGVSGLVQADLTKLAAVDSTAAELNIVDGGTSATSTTVADADRVVLNDNGTMVQVAVTDLAAYFDDEITAMPNLTSVGTLTTLTVDSIIINGTNIGHTSDADAIAIASNGNVTVSQNLTVTGDLTVSGDDITMGTNTAGNLLIADGTNFNSVAAGSLSEISSIADDDVFIAVDTSGGGLKKVARSTVVSGLATSSAISNVADDSTPQLGGDLDMNGQDIVTTSNADLELAPNGTGHVTVKGNTNPGTIQFNCENNSHGQQLKPQPHSVGSSAVHTLPNVTGELMPGKIEGTNFTDSLLVGHATTGTLDAAQDNTGVGIGALDALTSGDKNTAVGSDAGTALTTASNNTLIGYEAGKGVVAANMNTVVGDNAFAGTNSDSNSASNTVVGAFAMNVSSGAKENTAIGRDAGREVTSGDNNIFLGYNAGANDSTSGITTGSGNVIIGTVDPDSRTGDRQLKITGNDGSTATTWISGDNNGIVTFADDLIIKDSGTIGSASDTDLLTLGSAILTVAGEVSMTTLDIGGTNVTSTAAELNILDGVTSTAAELNILDGVTTTAAEINLIDGGTARGTTAVADADGILHNDNGTMRMTSAATFKTYFQSGLSTSSAADDITAGDAAVNITTSSGNITIDAAANDSDIIFKGTDDSSDITMLTLDGSDAGSAIFNHDIKLADNGKAIFGTGGDLEIYHDTNHSYVEDVGTGELRLKTNGSAIRFQHGSETLSLYTEDGSVELYHDDSKKFETASTGVIVTGSILPAADDTHDLGSSSKQWRDIYTGDINLNNTKTRDNEVDGSRGSWTIQEGSDDLFLLNRLNGKKYKFNLTEV